MAGRRYRQVFAITIGIIIAFCISGGVQAAAQGLGGTGTVQGTVKEHSATSCRSAACGPIDSSIRRSSRRVHERGDSVSFFNRLDAHAGDTSTFHLNMQAARSSFDVPNTFDQNDAGQAQHQAIDTFNLALGYSSVFGSKTLFTANAFVRRDHLTYTRATARVAAPPD